MENQNNTLVEMDNIKTITVTVMTVSQYIKPYCFDWQFEGDTKFTQAMGQIISSRHAVCNDVVIIRYTNKSGSHKHEMKTVEFVKYLAIEMLRNTLKTLTDKVEYHAKGFVQHKDNDEHERITDEEYNAILNSYEDGSRYWKNVIVQQTEIENAKKKSIDNDDFGSGNPTV